MPDPQNQADQSAQTTPPPDLSGLRIRQITQAPASIDLAGLRTRTVQAARAALPQPKYMAPGEGVVEESALGQAYKHAQDFITEHADKFGEKYLAPFRTGLDRMAEDLEQAGESGHTKSGGQLTGPTRALASGVGELLKQVPVGKDVKDTAERAVTSLPEFPEVRGLSRELKAGETAAKLDFSHIPGHQEIGSIAKGLPPQPRLPDNGTHAAIKTDDGSIYFDDAPEKQRTHIMLAKDLGIPPERVVSGGWLKDGEYEGSARSDAGKWGQQARAQAAVAEKRAARSSQTEPNPPKKSLADRLSDAVTASGKQGGHAGGGVASVEELARPGRFVKISRSGIPTDQNKVPDFNLRAGEAGYQVKPDGTWSLQAGQETYATKAGIQNYAKEWLGNKKR